MKYLLLIVSLAALLGVSSASAQNDSCCKGKQKCCNSGCCKK